ncbi:hypothetical protein GCM10011357_21840 [Lacimicrobium alkaliphilum]|uniref:Purine nucleoside phosphorylase n=2 Tax=Lacimicrobium alkaliphilum TaxID=1526571 RepID=A0ABQ1RF14_9ALTE|nr:hypothetical protein GCM10011357_21840 [Lacimicrobium alkaliphilum]
MDQVHGNHVIHLTPTSRQNQQADAAIATEPGVSCAVMTADCLPVLLCRQGGTAVAAVHCGWRGLAAGILDNTLKVLPGTNSEYMAWLGPAIGSDAFEVGEDVRKMFPSISSAFKPAAQQGKYWADIYAIAKSILQHAGVMSVSGGEYCTYSDSRRYFSYRRDGKTGRMASVIWLSSDES